MWRTSLVALLMLLYFPVTINAYDGITLERWQDYTIRERLNYVTGCVEGYTRLARSQGKEIVYKYRNDKGQFDDERWELQFLPRQINRVLDDQIVEDTGMNTPVGEIIFKILKSTLRLKEASKEAS